MGGWDNSPDFQCTGRHQLPLSSPPMPPNAPPLLLCLSPTEMDGFEDNTGVVVMAATNRPSALDKALTRPGRFDRIVHLPLPNVDVREHSCQWFFGLGPWGFLGYLGRWLHLPLPGGEAGWQRMSRGWGLQGASGRCWHSRSAS